MLEKYEDLLNTKKVFANLATLMADGTPQVTPVWIDYDGTHLIVNTAAGRVKDKNMRRNPNVAVALSDPENPYRYVEVRGKVAEVTETGAADHINKMAKKYMDKDVYPFSQPGEVRVLFKIKPEKVSAMG